MRECRGRGGAHNLACAGATPATATGLPTPKRSETRTKCKVRSGDVALCSTRQTRFGVVAFPRSLVPFSSGSLTGKAAKCLVFSGSSPDRCSIFTSGPDGRSTVGGSKPTCCDCRATSELELRSRPVLFTSPWPYGEIGRRTVTKPLRDQLLRENGSRVASVAMTCRRPLYTRGDCPSRIGNARSERRGVRVRVPVSAKTGNLFSVFTIQHHPPTSTPALKETCRPSQQFVAGRYMRGGLLGPKQVYLTDSPHKGLPEKEGTKRNKQDDQLTRPTGKAGRGMLGNRSNPAPFDC